MQQLKPGAFLQGGKYRIEKVLGQGGFGITYLATQRVFIKGTVGQIETVIKLAIKEFFMKEYCNRDGDTSHVSVPSEGSKGLVGRFRQKFIKEAQTIAGLEHPHVIRIYDVFEENGTAYYVMEYLDNGSLHDLVNVRGKLAESDALHYIRQIADALAYIHERKMNHLDVKPGNILLDEKNEPVLIDFGLSKRYDEEGLQTSTTPVGISHGYAPMEQYKKGGVSTFSPATDVYSLGATLYKLLTGNTPPEASDVNDDGLPELPAGISSSTQMAVNQAMQPRRKDRPQSMKEFIGLLAANDNEITTSGNEETAISGDDIEVVATEVVSSSPEKRLVTGNPLSSLLSLFAKIKMGRRGVSSPVNEAGASEGGDRKRHLAIIGLSLLLVVSVIYIYRKYVTPPVDYSTVAEAVDLGLSVNWASWNLGASSPDGYGAQLPWGKTDSLEHGTLRHEERDDISGSEYDIAREKWKDNWRIPTTEEFAELREKCLWSPELYGGVSGFRIVGPNGNSIFLPDNRLFILGYLKNAIDGMLGNEFKYWTSGEVSGMEAWSHDECHVYKRQNLYIRPVSDNLEKMKKDSVIAEVAKTVISAHAGKSHIDLGLSVLWATHNIGASKVEDAGDYYSWGETNPKSVYRDDSTYLFDPLHVDDIIATEHDAAYMHGTGRDRLPSGDEVNELIEKCTWIWGEYNDVPGMIVVGPNGNAIFLPAAGEMAEDKKTAVNRMGSYVSGTGEKGSVYVYSLGFSGHRPGGQWVAGFIGRTIRSVRSINADRHKAVDLGLSVMWADCNVGASTPADYGNYFAWGEISPKSNYYDFNSDTYGDNIGNISGNPQFDAARANWGDDWRMPTREEFDELLNKCRWTSVTLGGHEGYHVTGPNGNSIFLPKAGGKYGTSSTGSGLCYYWSATSHSSDYAYHLEGHSMDYANRYYGYPVRPVCPVPEVTDSMAVDK